MSHKIEIKIDVEPSHQDSDFQDVGREIDV